MKLTNCLPLLLYCQLHERKKSINRSVMDFYNAACRPGGNYWNYQHGVLSLDQVNATFPGAGNETKWQYAGITGQCSHDSDVIMGLKSPASRLFTQPFNQAQIKQKHQSSLSPVFLRGIHRWPVNSSHKWPVTRNVFPFDDVIMSGCWYPSSSLRGQFISNNGFDYVCKMR